MTITEFLLARIAEDEAAASASTTTAGWRKWAADSPDVYATSGDLHSPRRCDDVGHEPGVPNMCDDLRVCEVDIDFVPEATAVHIARHDPARVLAECEAKRRIVERADVAGPILDYDATWAFSETLRDLAAVYADHPDYDEDWRP